MRPIHASALLLALGACRVGPDYEPPEVEVPGQFDATPDAVGEPGAKEEPVVEPWWEAFGDPVLQACVEEAFASNLEVRATLERIRAARALRGVEASRSWPEIGAGAGYTWDRISENNPRFGPAVQQGVFPRDIRYWDVGFDVTWELDVFGGNARRREAATAELHEVELRRGAVMISVAAEIAREYVELRGEQERLRLLEARVGTEEARLELLEGRQREGILPAEVVVQRRSALQRLRARIPASRAAVRAGEYRLAVLMGRRPEEGVPGVREPRPVPSPEQPVPFGLPGELLRRRPDVLAAERRLAAATADIGVATAELYPRLFLVGSPGLQAEQLADLFTSSSSSWLFGPRISWSLFSGGRNRALLEAARAARELAVLEFEAAVQLALEEVETGIVRYARDAESLVLLEESAALSRRNVELAAARSRTGIVDRLEVLDSRASALELEEQRLDQEVRLLTRRVALYKALGGGWGEAERIARAAAEEPREPPPEEARDEPAAGEVGS